MVRKSNRQDGLTGSLPPLSRFEQQILAHLMTAIELGNYDDVAPMEDLAKAFNRDSKRFKRVINQLVRKGYVIVGEDLLETVYLTASALRQQTRDMSQAGAQEILKRLGAPKSRRRR